MKKDGDELFDHYRHTLENLGNEKGLLGLIFNKSQNKFQNPAKLRRLIVDLIDKENWSVMSADVKGDAYEGLLEKNAQDTKSGAGQYFTPRPLIQAIVDVIAPKPGETVCDPACSTGGFLLAAHDAIVAEDGKINRETETIERDDFWATTSNKQLNFMQHVKNPQAGQRNTLDQKALDLRSAHQHPLHPQDQSSEKDRPRRVRPALHRQAPHCHLEG